MSKLHLLISGCSCSLLCKLYRCVCLTYPKTCLSGGNELKASDGQLALADGRRRVKMTTSPSFRPCDVTAAKSKPKYCSQSSSKLNSNQQKMQKIGFSGMWKSLSDSFSRGLQLTRSDFSSVWFCKKTGFRFGFGFTKLTVVSVFRLSFLHCVV